VAATLLLLAACSLALFALWAALRRYRERRTPDPAWKSKGTRRTTEPHYDQQKASAGAAKAKRSSQTGRPYQPRQGPVDVFMRKAGP
jgi:hypothetical protein